jgi:hypothetical protein
VVQESVSRRGEGQLYLEESFGKAALLISKEEGEVSQEDYARTMRLHVSTDWSAIKLLWQMEGLELKSRVKPVSTTVETDIIWTVEGELRKLADRNKKKATCADNLHHSAETFSLFFHSTLFTLLNLSCLYKFYHKNA